MTSNYSLIAKNILTDNSTTSVTFAGISDTYTDLVLRIGARSTFATTFTNFRISFNDTSTNVYSTTYFNNFNGTANSFRDTGNTWFYQVYVPGSTTVTNAFGSMEIYIPNYTATRNKPVSLMALSPNNASGYVISAGAGLFRSSSAISSIIMSTTTAFESGSSFFLYGIKNS